MGGTRNGVLVYAYLWGKEPGDKIIFSGARRTRNDDAAHRYSVEECKVGIYLAESFFRFDFHEVIEAILASGSAGKSISIQPPLSLAVSNPLFV